MAASPASLVGPDGTQRDRIVGYLGEDAFWSNLGRMFRRAGIDLPVLGAD